MNNTRILVVGTNKDTVLSTLNAATVNGWTAIPATTTEQAIEKFQQHDFDMLVLTGMENKIDEKKLRALFLFQHPLASVIYQSGNEAIQGIASILDRNKNEKRHSYSFIDVFSNN